MNTAPTAEELAGTMAPEELTAGEGAVPTGHEWDYESEYADLIHGRHGWDYEHEYDDYGYSGYGEPVPLVLPPAGHILNALFEAIDPIESFIEGGGNAW